MTAFDTLYTTLYDALFASTINPEMGELACTLASTFGTCLVFALPLYLVWSFCTFIGRGLR